MASLNITSLLKHLDELKLLLNENPIDVFAINETRLDSYISDCEVCIPVYEIFWQDHTINGRHGRGVCFYVRNSINCTPRHDLKFRYLENLCIEICKSRSKPFFVAIWYRPPDSSVDKFDFFEAFVGKMDVDGLEYYIVSDMNTNLIASTRIIF